MLDVPVLNMSAQPVGAVVSVHVDTTLQVPDAYAVTDNAVAFRFDGSVRKQKTSCELEGRAIADFSACCDSCLAPIGLSIAFDVSERFSIEQTDLEDNFRFDGRTLDFSEALVTNLLLQLPVQFLCGPSCKGLCMECGADLNTESCGCSQLPRDSRFDVLYSFFDE